MQAQYSTGRPLELKPVGAGGPVGAYCSRVAYAIEHGRLLTWALEAHAVDHCNLRCVHCCTLSPRLAERFLDPRELERDLALAARVLRPAIFKLTGGEPLLHPGLTELLDVARASGISPQLSLTTNGLLLERQPDALFERLDRPTTLSLVLLGAAARGRAGTGRGALPRARPGADGQAHQPLRAHGRAGAPRARAGPSGARRLLAEGALPHAARGALLRLHAPPAPPAGPGRARAQPAAGAPRGRGRARGPGGRAAVAPGGLPRARRAAGLVLVTAWGPRAAWRAPRPGPVAGRPGARPRALLP